ncbi:hypothetical protein Pmani_024026 [Petrolisthes manimaculis]|uniref:Uncharacterized protein n=1 Tax=Petrolisthes manimaculis TaxID=1843537 RepID=A0AAE1PA16_9EUCA|nr:hypothetical protein Pmani_024026 [Petrolisthes manimaculis]
MIKYGSESNESAEQVYDESPANEGSIASNTQPETTTPVPVTPTQVVHDHPLASTVDATGIVEQSVTSNQAPEATPRNEDDVGVGSTPSTPTPRSPAPAPPPPPTPTPSTPQIKVKVSELLYSQRQMSCQEYMSFVSFSFPG